MAKALPMQILLPPPKVTLTNARHDEQSIDKLIIHFPFLYDRRLFHNYSSRFEQLPKLGDKVALSPKQPILYNEVAVAPL
jgi:hypothetical protein